MSLFAPIRDAAGSLVAHRHRVAARPSWVVFVAAAQAAAFTLPPKSQLQLRAARDVHRRVEGHRRRDGYR